MNATTSLSHQCATCGKYTSAEVGFCTREFPGDEGSYMVVCCDEVCADEHVKNYQEQSDHDENIAEVPDPRDDNLDYDVDHSL